MKKLGLALAMVGSMLMCGCSANQPLASLIQVGINPATPPNIDQGQAMQFTAGLFNDTLNKGVTWSLSGPGCSGAACGTLSNVTSSAVTYHAPTPVSGPLSVTVTATSVAAPTQNNTVTFLVMPPPSIVTTNLPVATPNQLYNATLQASGGVLPLNWSVASGSLPAGLSLNSAGVIYGMPTTGGTSNFTIKVTDSAGVALNAQQPLGITVAGILTIPPANLPTGVVGAAYSTTLTATGGVPPLSWSIYSGSLPTGLVLQQNTGVISGTPAESGTYSFILYIVDSSPIQQYFYSSTFSITISPSGPLTITSKALADATVGASYQAQLVATGGTLPLSWSVSSGTLPAGLTLSSTTGAISGTPTASAGTYSFSVTVLDSSSPQQTYTQALSITVEGSAPTCSSSGNNGVLVGQYAFSLSGYNSAGFLAVVGSFTADGSGQITAGEADTNGVLGAQNGNLIASASSYSVGPDSRGCATLATPFGTFFTRFAVGAVSAGVATQGRIIEFDNPDASAYIASGQLLQQTATAFLTPLTGTYYLKTSGWDSTTAGRVACVGLLTGSAFKFSYLQQDCNDDGTVTSTVTTSTGSTGTTLNTYTAADTNGRATGVISVVGNASDITYYWVNIGQLLMLNADASPTYSGTWTLQNVPAGNSGFNQGGFSANLAGYWSGVQPSGVGGDTSVAYVVSDGISSETTQVYRDFASTWQPASTTCNYSVVAIGRITLSGGKCGNYPPIPYLNAVDAASVLGTDSTVEVGSFEPQTAGLTNASLAGTYYVGTSEVVNQGSAAEVGTITLTSSGVLTSTIDSASTLNQTAGVAGFDTFTLNSNGTLNLASAGANVVGVAISGNKFVLIGDPTLTFPILEIGQR